MADHARRRLLVGIVLVVVALGTLVWALSRRSGTEQATVVTLRPSVNSSSVPAVAEPPIAIPSVGQAVEPTPQSSSSANVLQSPSTESAMPQPTPWTLPAAPTPQASTTAPLAPAPLLIPVAGVRPEQLRDTFTESRSEGRAHDAIDIPAPRGTPVLAAADGRIVKLFQSERGGTTIYQLAPDNHTIYYYAHLDRYADGLIEGRTVHRGETIAYVGDTGNAGDGNYHLHFSILIVQDPKRYWDGTNINPYPLLVNREKL